MLSDGQSTAIYQLNQLASAEATALAIDNIEQPKINGGSLIVDISLDCSHYQYVDGGFKFNKRESFRLYISSEFPFRTPKIESIHNRFLGFPHVQWGKRLCLFISTEVQWQPSSGMYGFISILNEWLSKATKNELDAQEGPIHPPVAYIGSDTTIGIYADTPGKDHWPWFGAAVLNKKKENYFEINHWCEVGELVNGQNFAPTLLLDFELPFEYPNTVGELLKYISERGVETSRILVHLMLAAQRLDKDESIRFVIGAPSRGVVGEPESRLQHIQVWEISVIDALKLKSVALACAVLRHYQDNHPPEKIQAIIDSVFDDLFKWQSESEIRWCDVLENRPEIVMRRDAESSMEWFKEKAVTLWGCGALGGQIAEQLVRAGVKKLKLVDSGKVHPGILVRQNFVESDINDWKAIALKRRLEAISNNVVIIDEVADVIDTVLNSSDWQSETDVLIDATASLQVRSKLESILSKSKRMIPIVAMMVSGQVRHGAMVMLPVNYSGGTLDAYRRLGLAARKRTWLSGFVDAFWGQRENQPLRQPEPGCSNPTFVGSHADVSAISSKMLNHAALSLKENESDAIGVLLRNDNLKSRDFISSFKPDIVIKTNSGQFRLSENAWRDIKGWIRTNDRQRTSLDETGGLLFGQFDEMLNITWVSNVSGPPRDSTHSPERFICGTNGVKEIADKYKSQSAGAIKYIGTWHSHPVSAAEPSTTDYAGIASVYAQNPSEGSYQTMLIVGYASQDNTELGLYTFERKLLDTRKVLKGFAIHTEGKIILAPTLKPINKSIGLALSGGGSRAVAFHLGTLRALEDLGILDEINTISGVSGGSLMTGILGYSSSKFETIDRKTIDFLRKGLIRPSLKKIIHPKRFIPLMITAFLVVLPAMSVNLMKWLLSLVLAFLPGNSDLNKLFLKTRWPLRRWYSRTHVIRDAIEDIVGSQSCDSPTRDNKNIVFNACELRTGTAFRMSNKVYGSWRFGSGHANELLVADAVTASASYPPFLPPFEWKKALSKNNQKKFQNLVITDGGVYENMGASVFKPEVDTFQRIVNFKEDIVIASDASAGQLTGEGYPVNMTQRMFQVFDSVMRKVNDATKDNFHRWVESGKIDGFIYVNLGQLDNRVIFKAPGWIAREDVMNYPTDFSAMPEKNIIGITNRGEKITRSLITQYLFSD